MCGFFGRFVLEIVKIQIDDVAVLVDHLGVIYKKLERFPPRYVRSYRLQRTTPFELAPYPIGLLFGPLRNGSSLSYTRLIS